MKRIGYSLFLGILFLTLQTTLLPYLPIQRIRPDMVLILILYWGLSFPPVSGGILSFFLGYLMDLFSGNSFGLYTFSRPLLFYVAQFFKGRIYLEGFLSQFLFVFLFALFEGLLILTLLSALNPVALNNLYPLLFTFYAPQSFLTGLIAPLLFFLLKKISFLFFPQYGNGIKTRERG
jgi:rod shape-determining protein MreD